jgi:hypothetical protein
MLRIRAEQMAAFSRAGLRQFEDRVLAMVQRHWPTQWPLATEDDWRTRVRSTITRAASYGITEAPDVTRYINISLALGPDFDRDPAFPWASALLQDTTQDPGSRLQRLCEYTSRTLSKQTSE